MNNMIKYLLCWLLSITASAYPYGMSEEFEDPGSDDNSISYQAYQE